MNKFNSFPSVDNCISKVRDLFKSFIILHCFSYLNTADSNSYPKEGSQCCLTRQKQQLATIKQTKQGSTCSHILVIFIFLVMRMLANKPCFPSVNGLIHSCIYREISVLKPPKKMEYDSNHFLMPKFLIVSKSVSSSKQLLVRIYSNI